MKRKLLVPVFVSIILGFTNLIFITGCGGKNNNQVKTKDSLTIGNISLSGLEEISNYTDLPLFALVSNGKANIYQLKEGEAALIDEISFSDKVMSAKISNDNKFVAIGGETTFILYSTKENKINKFDVEDATKKIQFIDNQVVVQSEKNIFFFKSDNLELIKTYKTPNQILDFAISPDNKYLVVLEYKPDGTYTLTIYSNNQNFTIVKNFDKGYFKPQNYDIKFSADNKYLGFAVDYGIYLYDLQNNFDLKNKKIFENKGNYEYPKIEFLPDNQHIIAVSNKFLHSLTLPDLEDIKFNNLSLKGSLDKVFLAPDTNYFIVSSVENDVLVFPTKDWEKKEYFFELKEYFNCFSPNSKRFITHSGSVYHFYKIEGKKVILTDSLVGVEQFDCSPDGQIFVAVFKDSSKIGFYSGNDWKIYTAEHFKDISVSDDYFCARTSEGFKIYELKNGLNITNQLNFSENPDLQIKDTTNAFAKWCDSIKNAENTNNFTANVVAVSHDNKFAVIDNTELQTSGYNNSYIGEIYVSKIENGTLKKIKTLKKDYQAQDVFFTNDNKYLVILSLSGLSIGNSQHIDIYDVENNFENIKNLSFSVGYADCYYIHGILTNDGNYLILECPPMIYNLKKLEIVKTFASGENCNNQLTLSPDGKICILNDKLYYLDDLVGDK